MNQCPQEERPDSFEAPPTAGQAAIEASHASNSEREECASTLPGWVPSVVTPPTPPDCQNRIRWDPLARRFEPMEPVSDNSSLAEMANQWNAEWWQELERYVRRPVTGSGPDPMAALISELVDIRLDENRRRDESNAWNQYVVDNAGLLFRLDAEGNPLLDEVSGGAKLTDRGQAFRHHATHFRLRFEERYRQAPSDLDVLGYLQMFLELEDARRELARRQGGSQRGMSVSEANEALMRLLEEQPDLAQRPNAREWGEKIGCSHSTVGKTLIWNGVMQQTGRGRAKGHRKPRTVQLDESLLDRMSDRTLGMLTDDVDA